MKLKPNYIIEFPDEMGYTSLIILTVNKKVIDQGCNAENQGLYGFRGLWYKGNGTKRTSYGKIYNLSLIENYKVIRANIKGLSKKQLREILK